jgi:CRISPR/Cas system-associated protein Csx1
MHTAELSVLGPGCLETEIAFAKLIEYKSPSSSQILAELIQARGEILLSEINKLVQSVWNREELPEEWTKATVAPMYEKVREGNSSNYRGISLLTNSYAMPFNILLTNLSPYAYEILLLICLDSLHNILFLTFRYV